MSRKLAKEIEKRRTFAIISHPDAGKTTMTERLLLMGGAIKMAGAVKAKKSKLHATSDWMEIEKKRGISVTSSVLKFPYNGYEVNLIDTPGHQDFSEDTYRTLTAVDSVLMLLDAAAGVEEQTKKLFSVCHMQKTPVIAFINKMDREGKDAFSLLEDIENVLGIATYPMTWPVGSGDRFKGLYHRQNRQLHLFCQDKPFVLDPGEYSLAPYEISEQLAEPFQEALELLDGAGNSWDVEAFRRGELAPVFFGSAMKNLGVALTFDHLLKLALPPSPRKAKERVVSPMEDQFSGFIFKIQANMDPSHRDRIGFMRICSGVFERDMKVHLVRQGKQMRLSRPTKFMAKDRSLIETAYAGDIVGVHDPGVFMIGDTITQGERLHFQGIPVFAPEHFATVQLKDPLKSKQLHKALKQLGEEGAVQVFHKVAEQRLDLGVVGELQFDVVKFRLKEEYGVNVELLALPYSVARWITPKNTQTDPQKDPHMQTFQQSFMSNMFFDVSLRPVVIADAPW
ncbi:MAG: peptide chain release factor 3, partial [Proteobacteria bacterium]|nr:peptide chain release factor 3 [Pseudomonadota bacterium]